MNSDHAPTAEEQLPELDEFSHSTESAKVAEGYYRPHRFGDGAAWFAASCELADRALQRERQLLAALRENREKDSRIAELAELDAACEGQRSWLITEKTAAEAKLRAVSDAYTRYFAEGRVDALLARIRAIVEGK